MSNTSQQHILVAEDDKLYAKVYQNKLSKEGYMVTVVNDGQVAFEKAKELSPDLILLDMIMPKMDGFQTLTALKNDPKTKNIKVVVMSNLGQDSDIEKAKLMGALDYFVKSNVSITELVTKIKELLG